MMLGGGVQADAAARGELDRVSDQIEQDAIESHGIAVHRGIDCRIAGEVEGQSLAEGLRPHQIDGRFDELVEPEITRFQSFGAGLQACIFQDGIDQRDQRFPRRSRGREAAPLRFTEAAVVEQLQHAHDAVQRRAQLVADDREKARFCLVGRHRRAARALGGVVLGKRLVSGLLQLRGALDHLAFECRIGFAQVSGHPVELIAERLQLVAGLDREPQAEVAALDPPRALRQDLDRHGHAPAEKQRDEHRTGQQNDQKKCRTSDRCIDRLVGFAERELDEHQPAQ
ncbi:hypothetical protein ACVWW2_003731 [Bradyrhizobium sp. LM4.3]